MDGLLRTVAGEAANDLQDVDNIHFTSSSSGCFIAVISSTGRGRDEEEGCRAAVADARHDRRQGITVQSLSAAAAAADFAAAAAACCCPSGLRTYIR